MPMCESQRQALACSRSCTTWSAVGAVADMHMGTCLSMLIPAAPTFYSGIRCDVQHWVHTAGQVVGLVCPTSLGQHSHDPADTRGTLAWMAWPGHDT